VHMKGEIVGDAWVSSTYDLRNSTSPLGANFTPRREHLHFLKDG
jgi:hypothetical protein